jgi:hypothetical protein
MDTVARRQARVVLTSFHQVRECMYTTAVSSGTSVEHVLARRACDTRLRSICFNLRSSLLDRGGSRAAFFAASLFAACSFLPRTST